MDCCTVPNGGVFGLGATKEMARPEVLQAAGVGDMVRAGVPASESDASSRLW